MIKFQAKGDWKHTLNFFGKINRLNIKSVLRKYADEGLEALRNATPVDTGKTKDSWYYEITTSKTGYSIEYKNRNESDGIPIIILLQYGHATKNGGYVSGTDFINPTLEPIFNKIANDLWAEVTA